MNAEYRKLIQSLKKKEYAPVYLVDGEEPYYIDQITQLFEDEILQPEERDFNLISLYGKETNWADVVNACRTFPMFAERRVVILKDAGAMRDFGELAGYLEKPAPTTVFLIEHRFKKADGRSKVTKLAKDKGIYFTSDKLKDEHMPGWIQSFGEQIGFAIPQKEAEILATYLGNDLQKIANEIEKLRLNVPGEKQLTAQMIQKYIGVSREYNIFEFAETLTSGNKDKLYRMLAYFSVNPKSAPMPLVIGAFYSHLARLYQACFLQGKPPKEISAALNVYGDRLNSLMATVQRCQPHRIEHCMLLLGRYSTNAVGINNNTGDGELLKEMTAKMELALFGK